MCADFAKLNTELFNVSKQIAEKSNDVEQSRIVWLQKKAEYENVFSRNLLETKIKNAEMTQSEIKAQAICITYQIKLDCITTESKYRRLMSELKSLNSMLESLQEISFNLRCELKNTPKSY